jgi:hypothetical protein
VPAWLEVLLLAIVGIVILFAAAGAIANARRERATREAFRREVAAADRALAAARAADRGWDREVLEAAARAALAAERPGLEAEELTLVEVLDRPGTDEDKAVFRVSHPGGDARLVLGRTGDTWAAERLE